jgi:hypothetical protein
LLLLTAGCARAQAPSGPVQQLLLARRLLSPACVGCVSQCATQSVGEALSQPAMRAVTMFGFRHLFWNEQKECAEFGEGLALVFRNMQLWHVVALFAHFYLQCTRECHSQCPYWGKRGKIAAALHRREREYSSDWVYKLGPSYAWEHRFAAQKRQEELAEHLGAARG